MLKTFYNLDILHRTQRHLISLGGKGERHRAAPVPFGLAAVAWRRPAAPWGFRGRVSRLVAWSPRALTRRFPRWPPTRTWGAFYPAAPALDSSSPSPALSLSAREGQLWLCAGLMSVPDQLGACTVCVISLSPSAWSMALCRVLGWQ